MEELARKKILVLGLGISGLSAADFCAAAGADVVAADERLPEQIAGLDELDPSIERAVGRPFPDASDFDLVVPSPGVPAERYREGARRVWGDIELAYRALNVPIIAVTGTNGKSTTVTLIEAMLRAAGARAKAAGNLGVPALALVGEPLDFAVLEVSSFQLETIEAFRPAVAVILNITPDHLDRHGSFAAYAQAKARLLETQGPGDQAVLNVDDPTVAALADRVRGDVVPIRTTGPLERGVFFDSGSVVLCREGDRVDRISLAGMQLEGRHNRENVVAAIAAVAAAGVEIQRAALALATFCGLPHRSELVAEIDGVRYVNDSKATNPGAALGSLASCATRVVWIAGGRDKDLDFGPLADVAVRRAHAAVLIGEAAAKIEAALCHRIAVHRVGDLDAAVALACELAKPGETVLLAPACASQDQFRSYEERGERFRAAVGALGRRYDT